MRYGVPFWDTLIAASFTTAPEGIFDAGSATKLKTGRRPHVSVFEEDIKLNAYMTFFIES